MFSHLEWQEALLRLAGAALCGGIIGLDRELRDKSMGTRRCHAPQPLACGVPPSHPRRCHGSVICRGPRRNG